MLGVVGGAGALSAGVAGSRRDETEFIEMLFDVLFAPVTKGLGHVRIGNVGF